MNLKKIILIVIFLAVTVGIGYLMYRLFFAPAPAPPTEVPAEGVPPGEVPGLLPVGERLPGVPGAPGVQPPVGLPTADEVARGGLTQTQLIAESAPVLAPTMTASGGLNYYNQNDGKFYRRTADGKLVPLSDRAFPAVSDVKWAPNGDKAVLEFPDKTKVVYDFEQQKQVTIPKHWEDFSFSKDGGTIAAKSIGLDPQNRWLITFAADGSNAKLVEPLGENADKVIVNVSPDDRVVAFSDTGEPAGFDTHDMILIGQQGENFKALRVEGFGFTPKWTPDGKNLLYSAAGSGDGYRPTLWFSAAQGDAIGQGRTNLGIHTWADKCTFSDAATAYCAVPDFLPDGAGLERAIANEIPDSLYKIDLRNGSASPIGRPVQDTTIKEVVVSPDGSRLYFTNASTGTLEEMRLR